MQKSKKLIIAVVAIVAAIAVMIGVYLGTRPKPVEGAKTITVAVVHSDGASRDFTYHTDKEYLGELLLDEGLIAGEDGAYGLYILTVDGEDAVYEEDGAYWALYEGEEYAQQGADQTPIADGDTFSLVYTVG